MPLDIGVVVKRQRDSPSPSFVLSAPVPRARRDKGQKQGVAELERERKRGRGRGEVARQARQRLFDALEQGDRYASMRRSMSSAADLSDVQLARCFDLLHACGRATNWEATLSTTRHSIEGFLDAVFHQWGSEEEGELRRPELEFTAQAEAVAGMVCGER